jgi:hypothetical protein
MGRGRTRSGLGGGFWEVSGVLECHAEDIQTLCKYCINQRELLRPVAAVAVKGRNGIWKRL